MTRADMLARMPATELDDWMRYARIEPFGEERADLRMGILASVIANANRDPKHRSQPFEPKDFIPDFGAAPEPVLTEEAATAIEDWKARARAMRETRA